MPNTSGLVMSNSQNQTQGHHIHNYSTFDRSLSYRNHNTHRFGEYTPTFVMEGVERDSITLNSSDKIDSLSLSAPFKGSIRKVKESFKVPLSAILPRQWDQIYVQPSNGEDVPADEIKSANCVIKDPCEAMFKQAQKSYLWLNSISRFTDAAVGILPSLICMEYFFSNGSLLSSLGCHTGFRFTYGGKSFDKYFDETINLLFRYVTKITLNPFNGVDYGQSAQSLDFYGLSPEIVYTDKDKAIIGSFRQFLDYMRENPSYQFSCTFDGNVKDETQASLLAELKAAIDLNNEKAVLVKNVMNNDTDSERTTDLNLSRILAYQLICAHFYTNSSIDPVYSAELFRQYIESIEHQINSNDGDYLFLKNGFSNRYDALSGRSLMMSTLWDRNGNTNNALLSYDPNESASRDVWKYRMTIIAQVFGYRKSLRYGDYFVGCRPRPLAPVNTDVAVASNKVSVVDITRSIQAQRFANSVMRSRSKIEEYVKSLFGKAPAPDYHNPFFLSREEETIYGEDVQNTGVAQTEQAQSRTGLFGSNMGRYTFTFDNDDMHPCIYMQLVHYDCKRAYTRTIDRQFFIRDRFDMFNPDYQYVGDQPVFGAELGCTHKNGLTFVEIFGYQGRDMEYKQRFDVASGGFVENLPGWIIDDKPLHPTMTTAFIGPYFIRSSNQELDPLFLSLTGYSLGNYFHFICITDNNVSARRAMAVDPQILA